MTQRRPWLPLLGAVAAALTAGGCGTTTHARATADRILFASDRTGTWALYSMDSSGENQQRSGSPGTVDLGGEGTGIGVPHISPDGKQVLIERGNHVVAETLATGKMQRLGRGEEAGASWSPDGTRVAYGGPGDNFRGVYVANVATGRRHSVLGDTNSTIGNVAWSPDGKWIAFQREIGYGPYRVWLVHPDGSGLKGPAIHSGSPVWAPDGLLTVTNPTSFLVVDPESMKVEFRKKLGSIGELVWSPDGERIAYTATGEDGADSFIYTANARGGDRHRLTPSGVEYDRSPVWSPDGKSLLFVRYADHGVEQHAPEIWTMRADGSHQRQLTHAYPVGGENSYPAWASGPVRRESTPAVQQTSRGLRIPFAVAGLGAAGLRAAIAPYGKESTDSAEATPPILLWRPGSRPTSLVGSPCGGISQLVFSGDRLALDCSHRFFDFSYQSMLVFDLRTRTPTQELFASSAQFAQTGPYGSLLGGIVAAPGGFAFEAERWTPLRRTKGFVKPELLTTQLLRVGRAKRFLVRSSKRLGALVGGTRRRLVFAPQDGELEVASFTGAPIRTLPISSHSTVLVGGGTVAALAHRRLGVWSVSSGRLLWERQVPRDAQLQAVSGATVAYSVGRVLHVAARSGERLVATQAKVLYEAYNGQPASYDLWAALTPAGLYYAYNVKSASYPGRVVFIPRR